MHLSDYFSIIQLIIWENNFEIYISAFVRMLCFYRCSLRYIKNSFVSYILYWWVYFAV